jgi:hypothetical protein
MPNRVSFLVTTILVGLLFGPATGAFAGTQNPDGGTVAEPRIVGGEEVAPEGKYPFVVTVFAGPYLCGGALIAEDWVLTAAHCVASASASPTSVVVGRHDLRDNDGETIPVAAKHVHPDYGYPVADANDVALLRLASPSSLGGPIPLARPGDQDLYAPGTLATVAGWGTTSYQGTISGVLLEVDVPIVGDAECALAYGSSFDAPSMVCGGYDEGGKDACQGDSGGPLFVASGGSYLHVGVVSFGEGCAEAGYPGVYAETAAVYSWISGTVGFGDVPTCLGLPVTIDMNQLPPGAAVVGTLRSDVILGTPGPDVIVARDGADYICSGSGDDQVWGGAGNDVIETGRGHDFAWGGPDDDQMFGEGDDDHLFGGAGDDALLGDGGDDELGGGWGHDWIDGGAGNDLIVGWAGNDELRGSYGSDEIWGNGGNDLLVGWAGDDRLHGGDGRDSLLGGGGTDFLRGGAGDDSCLEGEDVIC